MIYELIILLDLFERFFGCQESIIFSKYKNWVLGYWDIGVLGYWGKDRKYKNSKSCYDTTSLFILW